MKSRMRIYFSLSLFCRTFVRIDDFLTKTTGLSSRDIIVDVSKRPFPRFGRFNGFRLAAFGRNCFTCSRVEIQRLQEGLIGSDVPLALQFAIFNVISHTSVNSD